MDEKTGNVREVIVKVESSNVLEVSYTYEIRDLKVTYKGNRSYTYFDVPADVFHNMLVADSIGSYINTFVKRQFLFRQVA